MRAYWCQPDPCAVPFIKAYPPFEILRRPQQASDIATGAQRHLVAAHGKQQRQKGVDVAAIQPATLQCSATRVLWAAQHARLQPCNAYKHATMTPAEQGWDAQYRNIEPLVGYRTSWPHKHTQPQPVVGLVLQTCDHVSLLEQVAGVRGWQAADLLLQQHAENLQQAHVGLLWWQLRTLLLQQQQQPARSRVVAQQRHVLLQTWKHNQHPATSQEQTLRKQQRQHRVLQQLIALTISHVQHFTGQSLAYAMQGLSAGILAQAVSVVEPRAPQDQPAQTYVHVAPTADCQAAEVDENQPHAVHLPAGLPKLLWQRLMSVAANCTAQQLAHCLEAGQLLAWQLDTGRSTSSSSSSTTAPDDAELCCWQVLEAAASGLVGLRLQRHQQQLDSWEAGQLLHALAGYVQRDKQHSPSAQQQWQQVIWREIQRPVCRQLVQRLADKACGLKVDKQGSSGLGRGITYMHGPSSSGISPAGQTHYSTSSSSDTRASSNVVRSSATVTMVVCSLQASAVLHVLPDPAVLESLLQQLQWQLQRMPAGQVLQLLQAVIDLSVEPWPPWLDVCYRRLEADLQWLQPQQLLQLLQLLPCITQLQPQQEMLAALAKMTAVQSPRLSWRQLSALPLSLAAVGYRPEPYWLKDYIAASTFHLQRQQQRFCTEQVQLQLYHVVLMLLGVAWLAAASAPPPASWCELVQQHLVTCLQAMNCSTKMLDIGSQIQTATCRVAEQGCTKHKHPTANQQPVAVLPADVADMLMAAFTQVQHKPSVELQQLLQCHKSSSGAGSSSRRHMRASRPKLCRSSSVAAVNPGQSEGDAGNNGRTALVLAAGEAGHRKHEYAAVAEPQQQRRNQDHGQQRIEQPLSNLLMRARRYSSGTADLRLDQMLAPIRQHADGNAAGSFHAGRRGSQHGDLLSGFTLTGSSIDEPMLAAL